jgi:hypothetical protein
VKNGAVLADGVPVVRSIAVDPPEDVLCGCRLLVTQVAAIVVDDTAGAAAYLTANCEEILTI